MTFAIVVGQIELGPIVIRNPNQPRRYIRGSAQSYKTRGAFLAITDAASQGSNDAGASPFFAAMLCQPQWLKRAVQEWQTANVLGCRSTRSCPETESKCFACQKRRCPYLSGRFSKLFDRRT